MHAGLHYQQNRFRSHRLLLLGHSYDLLDGILHRRQLIELLDLRQQGRRIEARTALALDNPENDAGKDEQNAGSAREAHTTPRLAFLTETHGDTKSGTGILRDDSAVVYLDGPTGDRQTESDASARPVPVPFDAVERVENAIEGAGRDSGTVIPHENAGS